MTSSNTPLLSVGMPVLNCANTLPQALRSLLGQTYPHWELWLMDDGSVDNTLAIAKSFDDSRIRILSDGKTLGISARLNQAIALSQGDHFARMDGDDIAYPLRFERQLNYLLAHPSVDLVGSGVLEFGARGIPRGVRLPPATHSAICTVPAMGFPIAHPTFLGRMEFFRRYGYRTYIRCAEDQDLLLRAYRQSQFANVPEILLGYRAERLRLRRRIGMRRSQLGSLYREAWHQHRADWIMIGTVAHLIKAGVETGVAGIGKGEWLLKQHCQACSGTDRQAWAQVLHGVS